MRPLLAAAVAWTSAAFLFSAAVGFASPPKGDEIEERVRLLDVPFVPQSETLCGGAAAAMILRYWGEPAALAEDFSSLVRPGESGIRTDALVEAIRSRGWTALSLSSTPSDVRSHLNQGRPVMALIRVRSGLFHYVVIVAWANGGVILHDPAVGPFRTKPEKEFEAGWAAGGCWTLLILPREITPSNPSRVAPPDSAGPGSAGAASLDGCADIVEEGVRKARSGKTAEAEHWFRAAETLCPTSALPSRELAGLRFQAEDWAGAAELAERALDRDPNDAHAARLLAGSLFLGGDVEGALRAWNRLSEPRVDLTRVDGLERIRYHAVASQLALPTGRVLTSSAFLRARRRLAEVPAQSEARLSLRPLARGNAQVDVAVLERPLVFEGAWDIGGAILQGFAEREIAVGVASPTGNGELWAAGFRWWRERPRTRISLAIPAAGGVPGIWRAEGSWERQSYAAPRLSETDTTTGAVVREERRHAAVSFADWTGPTVRLQFGVAFDTWDGRGDYGSAAAEVGTRWFRDRVAVDATFANWTSLWGDAPFHSIGVLGRCGSKGLVEGPWLARAGVTKTSSRAPFDLWPGAGTGAARVPLLRAHPLLHDGVLDGPVFGQTLVYGGLERKGWAPSIGPVHLGWAIFLDAARAWDSPQSARMPWRIDGGIGLRAAGFGRRGELRFDWARGFQGGESEVSIRWEER